MAECKSESCGCAQPLQMSIKANPKDRSDDSLLISRFRISGMDCPSEERMIRMAVEDAAGVFDLIFDIPNRQLDVVHRGEISPIERRLQALNLGATRLDTGPWRGTGSQSHKDESWVLKVVLAINFAMFLVEFALGWVYQSTGLIADSLDMFADAAVYGVSLYAVGRAASTKLKAAHLSGWLQLLLAVGAGAEVLRRLIVGSEPESFGMIGVASIALAANVTTLVLLSRHRGGAAHMKASWIFTTNDVLANIGVIAAGSLVAWTGSHIPDLIIGAAISLLVMSGAVRILRLRH